MKYYYVIAKVHEVDTSPIKVNADIAFTDKQTAHHFAKDINTYISDRIMFKDIPVKCIQCRWTGILADAENRCCPDCESKIVYNKEMKK